MYFYIQFMYFVYPTHHFVQVVLLEKLPYLVKVESILIGAFSNINLNLLTVANIVAF